MFFIDNKYRYLHSDYFSQAEIIKIAATFLSGLDIEFKTMFIDNAGILDEDTKNYISNLPGINIIYELAGKEIIDDTCILIRDRQIVHDQSDIINVSKPVTKPAAKKSETKKESQIKKVEIKPSSKPISFDDL